MKVPSTITALVVGIILTLVSLWIGQNHGLLPLSASDEAKKIDDLFNAMMAISAGLFFIVQGAILYSVFAFRRRSGDDTDALPIEGNIPLEILWTAVPTVIVMWLAVYSFDVYKSVDGGNAIGSNHMAHAHHSPEQMAEMPGSAMAATMPSGTAVAQSSSFLTAPPIPPSIDPSVNPLVVNVAGLQYAWIMTYPETGIVSGELRLPKDRPVRLNISANDVIHAFWVPEFRLKQDAIPGQETHLSFTPNRIGTYPLICAELCGAYHGGMKTRVIVQTPEEYQAWEDSQKTVALKDPVAVASLIHDEAMTSQVKAMGFGPDRRAMDRLHQVAVSETAEVAQLARSL
ncbi:cytochrome c oxidase subunit II [Altericista sp. CCNU0014]|uniref:cytochrome c oxidase subunit II n=1 Tax=Altericista sp. CCNU0014 TaxID=3082949 RepID=UPI00384D641D